VIMAKGALSVGQLPAFPVCRASRVWYHTADGSEGVSFEEKGVGIIGTGSSGCRPSLIAESALHLTVSNRYTGICGAARNTPTPPAEVSAAV